MTKLITYLSIAVVIGLSRIVLQTPWWLITAPIWAPISVLTIDTIIHKIKRQIKDGRNYY